MDRAFLYLEGALLQHSAHESPSTIREETVRKALVDGLKCAKTGRSPDVVEEEDVPWNAVADINSHTKTLGSGRSKQHDVAIKESGQKLLEAVVEVKWLRKSNAREVLEDIWKLALTHGNKLPEKDSTRTFLLVGGLKNEFQKTLDKLRGYGVPLRWSPQGSKSGWPKPVKLELGKLANQTDGQKQLVNAICRRPSGGSKVAYHRTPPVIWWNMRCTVVSRSWKTIRGKSEWKIALWEVDYKKVTCGDDFVDWSPLKAMLP